MGKQINPYLESFIVAFSATLGLSIGVYIINLILPSYEFSIIVILGAVFVGIFGISIGYLKRFSSARIVEKINTAPKKDTMPLILNTCIFLVLSYLFLYLVAKRLAGFMIITLLGILLIVYSCFFIRYLISAYRKIKK